MYGANGETETRNLKCQLDHDEVHSRADQVATLIGAREDIERDKKSANDEFREQLGNCDTTIAKMSREVRERAEYRDTECKWVRDDDTGVLELIREDTGEVLHKRNLTDEEKQLRMFEGGVVSGDAG